MATGVEHRNGEAGQVEPAAFGQRGVDDPVGLRERQHRGRRAALSEPFAAMKGESMRRILALHLRTI